MARRTLRTRIKDDVFSIRHAGQVERLAHDRHLRRDVGLDHTARPENRETRTTHLLSLGPLW